ncbi:unnamed protein product [Linum trigynum]|uniref:C2 domain-containing protein n=1 Tax=Linum trigynum TaxID=586398 RepID=A0AAV2FW28_9ROSI
MASHSHNPFDLEITIISAKHLKNVNWRNGDLKPYATIYLDNSDHRLATHADDSGSTRPVWNERFTLPVTRMIADSVLTLEILHSRPSETPKPLVGAVKIPLSQILDSDESPAAIRSFELLRPSGRPHGKVRLKLALRERPMPPPPPMPAPPPPQQVSHQIPDYHSAPNYSHYYAAAPPPPPAPMTSRDYREFSPAPYNYPDQYGYYSAYYPPQPPLPSRPLYNRASSYNLQSGPSAPVDISAPSPPAQPYDHKVMPQPSVSLSKTSVYGGPSGPSAPVDYSSQYGGVKGGATELSSSMGGLNLEESGSNYEREKAPDRESFAGYRDYRHEY